MFGGNKVDYVQLSSLCLTFIDGDWIESKDQSESGIRLIQTGNVGCGEYKDKGDKAKYITEDTFNKLHCTEIYPGDILISRLPDPVGRACVLPEGLGKCVTAVDCTIIRFSEKILPNFFVAYTNTPEYLTQIKSTLAGTTRLRVSRGNLGKVKIPVPSIEQQRTFVSIAEQADKSKFSCLKSQFIEMFFNTRNAFNELPISDICSNLFAGGDKPSDCVEEKSNTHPYPVIANGVGDSGIIGYVPNYQVDRPSLTISARGTIGYCAIREPFFTPVVRLITIIPNDKVNLTYLKFYLEQTGFEHTGAVQGQLTIPTLKQKKVLVPSIEEQNSFSAIVAQADKSKQIAFSRAS